MAHKGLIAWAVLGLSGLIFQATLFFKDEWAAHHVPLRPVLKLFCEWSECQLEPLQVADAVLIDHASVDMIPKEESTAGAIVSTVSAQMTVPQWRFQITLRNAQDIDVAMPWIELTLTDSGDQALMRKVFNPTEFGAPQTLKAGEIWSQDLRLRLVSDQVDFMGYRLFTFYP